MATRVLIYGVTGSGKTWLAERLSQRTGLPWHSVDDLTWLPGWVTVPTEEQRAKITTICAGDRWILDTAYGQWLDVPLPRAEVIVALDYPRLVSLWQLVRRTLRRVVTRELACNGNTESARQAFSTDSIVVWHFKSFARKRDRIRAWAADPDGLPVIRLTSPRATRRWLAALPEGKPLLWQPPPAQSSINLPSTCLLRLARRMERDVQLTIPAALARAAQDFGSAPAVAEPGGPRLSYADLRERVREVAAGLVAGGIEAGDRVAIWSPNTHHWVLAALGALQAGATLVPVNTRFTGPEALDIISRSGATALIVAGPFLGTDRLVALLDAAAEQPAGDGSLERLRLIVRIPVNDDADACGFGVAAATPKPHALTVIEWDELTRRGAASAQAQAEADQRAAAVTPDQVSDILFTSGTTGRSKGAMSAHRQALEVARAWAGCGEVSQHDNYLVVNPFFHSFGYKAGILVCLLTGATIVPQLVYDPRESMRLIAAERITVFPGAPTIYQTILDHPDRADLDLSSLRLAVTGAATVPVALVERMQAELSFDVVLTAYGLTEAVVVTMCRPGDDPKLVATTSGRATAGFEVRLDDRTGEILLRGPNVMLGYLDDPEATATAIDQDGWLHTGDVGQLDDDGYLVITDRLKDMYICGGFNVYPAEVEQVLARLDGVAESAVIGVPDARLGEVGKAFVVTRPGFQLTGDAVLGHCRDRMANYKVPRQLEFRTELPRNLSGKTLKRLLREESQ